ncbi:MAG TPA: LacI family transcriptional regulator, partial [Bacteroidetes bacterium]|nr:LacI family transcriptional regulator [Bacteroidota bacterium]
EGIEAELAINNYNLILNIAPQDVQNDLPKVVLERQVDGVILIGIFENRFIEKLMSEQVKFVLVDPKTYLENCAQVCIDNEHGAFLATDYLIKSGHKKIAFISGSLDRLSFKQRYNGYIKALKFNNIKVNSKLVSTGGLEEGYEHAKSILSNTKITAIFAANDINAIYAYRAIREMDSKIPDDISVVGFDDIDLSKFSIPPLTTIRVYKEEMGSIAVRTLLGLIKNEIKSPITTVVPVKLIERESVKKLQKIA